MSREEERTTLFLLVDRTLDGQLESKLRRWRAAGVSLRSIQALLADEVGVSLAPETIRRWIRDLDNGDESSAA